jgi:8-oxo-dGTP diphosphatase
MKRQQFETTRGIICNDQGEFLMLQMKPDNGFPYWEFPGGKVEKDETIRRCFVRELKEELNIDVVMCVHLKSLHRSTESFDVDIRLFRLLSWEGRLTALQHPNFQWMKFPISSDIHLLYESKLIIKEIADMTRYDGNLYYDEVTKKPITRHSRIVYRT